MIRNLRKCAVFGQAALVHVGESIFLDHHSIILPYRLFKQSLVTEILKLRVGTHIISTKNSCMMGVVI